MWKTRAVDCGVSFRARPHIDYRGLATSRPLARVYLTSLSEKMRDFLSEGELLYPLLVLMLLPVAMVVIERRPMAGTHNPLQMAAGFAKIDLPVPWLGKKRLRLRFG